MGILSILALLFVICYFGGWGIQAFVKYTVAAAVFIYGGIALIVVFISKLLTGLKESK
ncbi:hypothetical protein ACSFB8_07465 [Enterococcus faecalis]